MVDQLVSISAQRPRVKPILTRTWLQVAILLGVKDRTPLVLVIATDSGNHSLIIRSPLIYRTASFFARVQPMST